MLRNLLVVFTKKPRAAKPAEPMIVFAVRYLTNQAHTDFDCTVLRQPHEKRTCFKREGLRYRAPFKNTPQNGCSPHPRLEPCYPQSEVFGATERVKLILRASNQNGRHGKAFPIAHQINTDRIPRDAVANCCYEARLAVDWLAIDGQDDVANQHTSLLGR